MSDIKIVTKPATVGTTFDDCVHRTAGETPPSSMTNYLRTGDRFSSLTTDSMLIVHQRSNTPTL